MIRECWVCGDDITYSDSGSWVDLWNCRHASQPLPHVHEPKEE